MKINLAEENILSRMQLPGSATQLAIFRILLGSQILYSASGELFNLLNVVTGTTYTKTIFPQALDDLIADIAVPYLRPIVQILSLFMIFGLFTRYILPFLFTSFLFLFSFWYSHYDAPVPWLYLWFPLLVLCFSRSSDTLSLDRLLGLNRRKFDKISINTYRWPVEVCSGWFAYIYFAAGIAKIFPVTKGLNWLDGGTSQSIIYDRFLDSALYYVFDKPFFDYSSNSWFFALLSVGALLIELLCVLIFFTSRYNGVILFLVLSMHVFLFLVGVPGFGQIALILGICLMSARKFDSISIYISSLIGRK